MSIENFNKIVPYLTVSDAQAAIAFYETAFGAECDVQRPADKNTGPEAAGKIVHASLKLNGGYVMLSDDFGGGGTVNPQSSGSTSVTVHIEIDDTTALWERAIAAGAESIIPLEDQFWGASFGKLKDPFGHVWSIGGPAQNK